MSDSVVVQSPTPGAGAPLINTEPPPDRSHSVLGDLRTIWTELRQCRDLVHQLTLRDIRIRYKQAVFGFAWALLLPMAVVFAGLTVRIAVAFMSTGGSGGGLAGRIDIAGMAVKSVPWAFFVGCINTATPSLLTNMSLVTKIYFPREVLPLGTVLAQTFDSAIGLSLVVIMLPFMGVTASWQLLWVPVLLVLLWVLALAFGLFLSCANIFFRDVKYLVQVFLTFGIFVTPVILDAPTYSEAGARIIMLNPVAPILEGLRLAVVEHHNLLNPMNAPQGFPFWHPWYLAYTATWAFGGLVLSALLFHRSERRFAELA